MKAKNFHTEKADDVIRARINSKDKAEATRVLKDMGMDSSMVIRVLFKRIAAEKRIPFDLGVLPNRETVAAIKELEAGAGKAFDSIDALFNDMET
jgi:DNA-damage-inducible protein J